MTLPPSPTGCRCAPPAAGTPWFWCDPHQCKKNGNQQRQCATHSAAFAAWQQGKGPGQGVLVPRPAISPPVKPVAPRDWSWRSLKQFTRALLKHARDWFRKCTRTEVQDRLAICQTCDQYTGTACAQCGCRVNLEKRFRNKLAWRSEACPLGKWPALSAHRWRRSRTSVLSRTPSQSPTPNGESHG